MATKIYTSAEALSRALELDTDSQEGQLKVLTIPFLIQRIAYVSGTWKAEYIGYAKPGTATSTAGWQIQKLTYSGDQVVSILFADGDAKFDNVWDDRASLSYS